MGEGRPKKAGVKKVLRRRGNYKPPIYTSRVATIKRLWEEKRRALAVKVKYFTFVWKTVSYSGVRIEYENSSLLMKDIHLKCDNFYF